MERRDENKQIEKRSSSGRPELRAVEGKEGDALPVIVHHAPQWGVRSSPLWMERGKPVVETFEKGAFAEVLGNGTVRALRDHEPGKLLGREGATLVLEEDETGLRYEITPPETELGRDTVSAIERGDLDGSSFAFTVHPDDEEWTEEENSFVRTIKKVSGLYDVGPVTYPAYPGGEALSLRSLEPLQQSLRSAIPKPKSDEVDKIFPPSEQEMNRLRLLALT